jgi:thiamine kinase-like enzyme
MKEFSVFTDANKMKSVFEQYLPGFYRNSANIAELSIPHVWYKTYRKDVNKSFLTALYKLKINNAGQNFDQMLYAKAFLQNRSQSEFRDHINARLTAPKFGSAFSRIPKFDLVIWSFPNDPALPWLSEMIEPEKVKKHLPFSVDDLEKINDIKIEVVNYRPELRCTTKYEIQAEQFSKMLFAKTFADESGAEIFERMKTLCDESCFEGFIIARPLAYDNALRTIWQEGLTGQPIVKIINKFNSQGIIEKISSGLAALHRSKISCSNKITIEDHLVELRKKTAKLIREFPSLQSQLQFALSDLERDQPAQNSWQIIHGDFHINQLMMSNERIALFDFDEIARGDPLQDIANFIADLYAQNFDNAFISRISSAFIKAYQKQINWHISPHRLDWHLRVQLLTRAYRSYWQRKPDVENSIRFYLDLLHRKAHLMAA